ncbi:hypothetical protein HPB50_000469 [Hyalomma asiaticum]|uniref:Uncharacterized protein n=1 Tax=Hyalomma asiaticum TaxID=266040 RepID=A0ACB7T0U5_HYAAI|nr:hypothetical protein HPB50_000469 [Hyalomma asiaticum]
MDSESGLSSGTSRAPAEKRRRGVGGWRHECSTCGQRFPVRAHLRQHQLVHRGDNKRHACSVCGRKFTHQASLGSHRCIGTREKTYACELCPSKYASKKSLRKHKQNHAPGANLHHCPECTMIFKSSTSLQKHQMRHNKKGPYTCILCPSHFFYESLLKDHVRTHAPEHQRPPACPVRKKAYAWQSSLTAHITEKHGRVKNSAADTEDSAEPPLLSGLQPTLLPVSKEQREIL